MATAYSILYSIQHIVYGFGDRPTTAINNLLAATTLNGTAFCERIDYQPELDRAKRGYAPEGVAWAGENRVEIGEKINKVAAAATQILRNWGHGTLVKKCQEIIQ